MDTDQELIKKNRSLVIIKILTYISVFAFIIFPPSIILSILLLIVSKIKSKNIEKKLQEKYEINKGHYSYDHEIFDPNYNF
jgi:hypothetical protein